MRISPTIFAVLTLLTMGTVAAQEAKPPQDYSKAAERVKELVEQRKKLLEQLDLFSEDIDPLATDADLERNQWIISKMNRFRELKEDVPRLKRELGLGEARKRAFQEKMVRIEKEIAFAQNSTDPVASQLQKIAVLDERLLEKRKNQREKGIISDEEVMNAERKALESQLEFTRYQWEATQDLRKAMSSVRSAFEDLVVENEVLLVSREEAEKELKIVQSELRKWSELIKIEKEIKTLSERLKVLLKG